ncbi:Malolactic regulator [Lacticaseibacillus rhamnosus LRHMDP2]|uniref:Malolactic regulator n=1 Tax=Lacticaseibacillus rhamnosus LRHMDP3 TaxID=1203259 RepID=A0AB33XSI5_LACRH|nr:Malolactic regulator [Lacticaseibacillus rhamnosus LRHMDP3]EKS50384.1 Malolactic regulator [Lacticaseibacillus rhamnosus LRHMDP2]
MLNVYAHAYTITRSPAQGLTCKDLGRNGQRATITSKAAYTPAPNHAGSRSRSLRKEFLLS